MTDWFEVAKDITQPVDRISEIRARLDVLVLHADEAEAWDWHGTAHDIRASAADIAYLLDRVEALEKDRERLDWLEGNAWGVTRFGAINAAGGEAEMWEVEVPAGLVCYERNSLREAIDYARDDTTEEA
jgi:hypothetical protein